MNRWNASMVGGGGEAKRDASPLVSTAYRACPSAEPTSRRVTIEPVRVRQVETPVVGIYGGSATRARLAQRRRDTAASPCDSSRWEPGSGHTSCVGHKPCI